MGAGYLQTGYYAGFFVAAALNYTVGAHFGWRAMFLCGLAPVGRRALHARQGARAGALERACRGGAGLARWSRSFGPRYLRRTHHGQLGPRSRSPSSGFGPARSTSLTAVGLLAEKAGFDEAGAARVVSLATAVLAAGTILGCIALPPLAERIGRRATLAVYFVIMLVTIPLAFGWAFYLEQRPRAVRRSAVRARVSVAAISRPSACGCPSNTRHRCVPPRSLSRPRSAASSAPE